MEKHNLKKSTKQSDDKQGIIVLLSRVSGYNFGIKINEKLKPVFYRGYNIQFIQESIFMYAIVNNGVMYTFDIRPITANLRLGNVEDQTWEILNDHEAWFNETLQQITRGSFYIDFEKSIAKANDGRFDNRRQI